MPRLGTNSIIHKARDLRGSSAIVAQLGRSHAVLPGPRSSTAVGMARLPQLVSCLGSGTGVYDNLWVSRLRADPVASQVSTYIYPRRICEFLPTNKHFHSSSAGLLPKQIERSRETVCKSWCLRPDLHKEVLELLKDDGLSFTFHHADEDRDLVQYQATTIMGRFHCQNKTCSSSGWVSKSIAVCIRLYVNNQYNAQVFRQRCKKCNHLGWLDLDKACYAERVTYRLKRWSGVDVERPPYSGNSRKPHETLLCEGCKLGYCMLDRPIRGSEDRDGNDLYKGMMTLRLGV
nr:hypothetical protein CFP56_31781 [Quercus suber]